MDARGNVMSSKNKKSNAMKPSLRWIPLVLEEIEVCLISSGNAQLAKEIRAVRSALKNNRVDDNDGSSASLRL